jgi:adenylosuccinate synthase
LDPVILKREIDGLEKYKLDVKKNLFISKKAQLILPTHRLLDAAYEQLKGKDKIGSTLKGIGPTYQDKIGRHGLRIGDIVQSSFKAKYDALVDEHKRKLTYLNYEFDIEAAENEFFNALEFLKEFNLVESEYFINASINKQMSILAEGAQGSLLDVDFGSYPFVTSSTTIASGACTGLGIAPRRIGEVFGIFKAYCTRVGSGPFPTELHDKTGDFLREKGHEFGSTTGRPRRCGWLDLPALKYAVMVNGATQLFMMKADVLNDLEEIKVCTHYRMPDGSEIDYMPYEICDADITPVYSSYPGWHQSLAQVKDFDQLPSALGRYIALIEDYVQVPVNLVSTGPDRTQTIIRDQAVLV